MIRNRLILNRQRIQSLEELQNNFNLIETMAYLRNGRLVKWLEQIGKPALKKKLSTLKLDGNVTALEKKVRSLLDPKDVSGGAASSVELALQYFDREEYLRAYNTAMSSDHSNPEIQLLLGDCYFNGLGIEENKAEAVKWYRQAAEQEVAWAQYFLGLCYSVGAGTDKDESEAVKWFRKAVEQEHALAQIELRNCLKKAAETWDAAAQYDFGNEFFSGHGEMPEDKAEAVKWYRKAAEQGHAEAQYQLGHCYENGEGLSENKAEAVKWYRKAAEQGHETAQRSLAYCYYSGEGIRKNKTEAAKWYRKAAEQGDERAQAILDVL